MNATRRGVIDIGSNTVRLVVYTGLPRSPVTIYNEKNRVGLGACLASDGVIDDKTMAAALGALARFAALARAMEVSDLRVVATAATREAKNGAEFVEKARVLGIKVEVLSGEQEARAAGFGIMSEFHHADGYVGDLGGGSLELIRICDGKLGPAVSLPLGTLRHKAMKAMNTKQIAQLIREHWQAAAGSETLQPDLHLPFYMIGGSWRAFARLHMHVISYPLTILSHYQMPPSAPAEIESLMAYPDWLSQQHAVPSARRAALPGATALLNGLCRLLKPSMLVTSVHGLREGLLFEKLDKTTKAQDPLIAATRFEGARLGRFAAHGDALAAWLTPLFADEGVRLDRLCVAASMLADCVWQVNPEYRAEDAMKMALDGNWPGVSASDRAVIARALFAVHAGNAPAPEILTRLAESGALDRAWQWGLAIRLAQRLDGGTGSALASTQLTRQGNVLTLSLTGTAQALVSGGIERRLNHLATAIGCSEAMLLA